MGLPTKLALNIVTPDHSYTHHEVDEVSLPGSEGDFGVRPGHTPLFAALRTGPSTIDTTSTTAPRFMVALRSIVASDSVKPGAHNIATFRVRIDRFGTSAR